MNIKAMFDSVPNSVTLHEMIRFNWSQAGRGWGELGFYMHEGKLMCMNECMSKDTVKGILNMLVDLSELDDPP